MRLSTSLLRLCLLLGMVLLAAGAVAQSLEIIELRYRTAEEIVPILKPLLEPGGAINGEGTKLFVRAGKANIADLRQALAVIDRPPKRLRVSVRRTTQQEIEREAARASATVRGSNGAISVNEPPGNTTRAGLRVTESSSSQSREGVASVQVIEGGEAFITAGTDVPLVTAVAGGGGRRQPWAAAELEYRNLTSGFLVRPRLAGDLVVVDINQRSETAGARDGQIETQRVETQVTGRPGEWLRLGMIEEVRSSRARGIATRQYSTASDTVSTWVRVDIED
jgi:type II secretory pathway component GspD/PulD (secretin)